MKFQEKLIKGKFIKRYKRFFTDVMLDDGSVVVAHCPNTGSMMGLLDCKIAYISYVNNPTRKLKYTLQILEKNNVKVGVNTHLTNHIAYEAILQYRVPELSDFKEIKKEVAYGSNNSRVDLLLVENDETLNYIEVKNVTLTNDEKTALFPDSLTTRGQKHLKELIKMVRNGNKATMLYIVNRDDCLNFAIASQIDPEYYKLFKEAIKVGVQMLAYSCKLTENEIKLDKRLDIIIN